MPCRDDFYDQDADISEKEQKKLQKRIDELTQNLCYLCGHVCDHHRPIGGDSGYRVCEHKGSW